MGNAELLRREQPQGDVAEGVDPQQWGNGSAERHRPHPGHGIPGGRGGEDDEAEDHREQRGGGELHHSPCSQSSACWRLVNHAVGKVAGPSMTGCPPASIASGNPSGTWKANFLVPAAL